jgi:hypothetical protein
MRFLPLLVVVAALSFAGAALGTNPPGHIGAQQTCKMLGYVIGTDTFTSCVQSTVNGSPPPAASTTATTTQSKVQRARQTCLSKGLTKGTAAFTRCVNRQVKLASKPKSGY